MNKTIHISNLLIWYQKWIIVFCFLLNSATAFAQYSNTSWYFHDSRIDFQNQPASLKKSNVGTSGCHQFVITNCNGDVKIIAYSNGRIYNGNEQVMKGSGKLGAAELYYLIDGFIYPGSKDSIVIFHDFLASGKAYWGYSIVDLTKDSGRGEVIKSKVIVRNRFNPTMTVVKHANNLDYWILGTSDSFSAFAYHFSNKGLNPTPVLSSGVFNDYLLKNVTYDFNNLWACLAPFVPTWDSKQIIVTGLTKWRHATACALIYDFDNSTGKITNPQELFKRSNLNNKTHYTTQKAAIAPNDTFIYLGVVHPNCEGTFGSNDFACFYQLNRFTKTKVLLKTQFVNTYNIFGFHGTNVTPEGTICVIDYSKVTSSQTINQLWRVERPNLEGKSCKYTPWLTDNSSPGAFFPTVLNRIAPTYFTVNSQINSCADTSIITLSGDTLLNKLVLRFGDGDTLLYTGPFKPNLTFKHFYKSNGNYPLTITTWNKSCNTPRWLTDTLAINKPPRNLEVNVTHNPTCDGDTVRVTLKAQNHQRYSVKWGLSKLGGGVYDTLLNSTSDSVTFQFYYPETDKKYKLNFSATNAYCSIAKSDSIAVVSYPKPKNQYAINLDSSCADKPLILSDSGSLWRKTIIQWFGLSDTISGTNNLLKKHDLPNATSAQNASIILTSSNIHGCLLRDTLQIHILPRPDGSIRCVDSVICVNQQTFIARIQKINQPANTKWTWWDGIQKSNDSLLRKTFVTPGLYPISLTAITTAGCTDTNTLLLTVKSLPKAAFSINNDTLCFRKESIQLFNSAICVDDTISSHWFATNNGDTLHTNTATISQPSIGKHTIKQFVSTNEGCFDTLIKLVVVNASPIATFQISQSHICDGQSFTAISDSTSFGDLGHWNIPQLGISIPVDGRNGNIPVTVTGKQTVNKYGRYTLGYYLVNAEGCRDSMLRSITINRRPMANFSVPNICVGQEVNFYSKSNIGDAPIRFYQWNNDLENKQGAVIPFTFKTAGSYPIEHVVLDTNGCADTVVKPALVKPVNKPQISWEPFRYNSNPAYTYVFSALPEGMKEYNWTFEEAGPFQGIKVYPSFSSSRDNVKVQLSITSPNGCISDTTILFNIMDITGFHFPSAITLNGDGLNEGFGIAGPEYIKNYELQVYNKWGEMVFKTNNPHQQWMPENPIPGQYVYYCKVSDIYNRFKEIKGTVLLIR